jgi:twitching motility two-component system response regulator PilG
MSATDSIAGLKVMVIDDSNTIRRSAEIFLKQAGCEVIVAEDGLPRSPIMRPTWCFATF